MKMNSGSTLYRLTRIQLVGAVVLPVLTFFATTLAMSIPPNTRGIDISDGRELFRAHCGSCHFAKAGFPAHHGPNLFDIGRSGANRKPGMTAAAYILESILDPAAFVAPSGRPGMPPNISKHLAPEEIRQIVGFLASCGTFPDYEEIVALEIPDRRPPASEPTPVRLSEMLVAEQLLSEKAACLQCHALYNTPDGQIHAPAIFGVGFHDRANVRESIVNPQKEVKSKYATHAAVLTNGESLTGQIMQRSESDLTFCLRDPNSNQLIWRQVRKDDIEQDDRGELELHQSAVSLMPNGLGDLLTPEELDTLLTLILQLN